MGFQKKIKISNKIVNNSNCFVVAEISGNHGGKIQNLKKIIDELDNKFVDAIKIKAYEANSITIKSNNNDFRIAKGKKWSKYKYLHELYKYAETPFNW